MADELAVFKFINPPGTGPIIRIDNGTGNTRDVLNFQKSTSEVFSVNSAGLPDPGGGDPKRSVVVSYGDLPADPDALEPFIYRWEKAVTITNAYVALDTTVGADAVNYNTLVLTNATADATIATLSTAAGIAANTWTTMGDITNPDIVAGASSYCYLVPTKTVSGMALSGLTFRIEFTLAG